MINLYTKKTDENWLKSESFTTKILQIPDMLLNTKYRPFN